MDLDPQRLSVEVVVDIKSAEASPGPHCIGHEVGRPSVIGPRRDLQRITDAIGQASFASAWQVELHAHVDSPTAGLAKARGAHGLAEQQAETVAWVVSQVAPDRLDQRRIPSTRHVVPCRARQARGAVGPSCTQAVVLCMDRLRSRRRAWLGLFATRPPSVPVIPAPGPHTCA